MLKNKINFLKSLLIILVLVFIIRNFIFNINIVKGVSMNPTLENNDVMFSLVLKKYSIKRGDIVTFKAPNEKHKIYIKRVIGLPNDEIKITNGSVYVNGELYKENYISTSYTEAINSTYVKLKDNEYFVMGDNRLPGKSEDSRYFGPIERSKIRSVVIFKIISFN